MIKNPNDSERGGSEGIKESGKETCTEIRSTLGLTPVSHLRSQQTVFEQHKAAYGWADRKLKLVAGS